MSQIPKKRQLLKKIPQLPEISMSESMKKRKIATAKLRFSQTISPMRRL
jgi:hypothetical protein